MPIFTSTYTNKVDKKGRVSVPASFRSTLPDDDQSVSIFPSLVGRAIEGFDRSYLDHIQARLDNYDMMTIPVETQDPAIKILSRVLTISIDSDGRIVLPQEFIKHAGIADRAVFVGLGSSFQIWSPKEHVAVYGQNDRL